MNNAHGSDRVPAHLGRTATDTHHGGLRARLTSPRARRAFSMVELAVSFVLFLILASVISLALARSFSTAATVRTHTQASAAVADELDKLAAVPYANLLSGSFTVPDACADSSGGIAGDSCMRVGQQQVRVSYGFKTSATDSSCTVTDAKRFAASYGYVTVNACVTSIGRGAFSAAATSDTTDLPTLSRQINAPRAGFKSGSGTVRAQLSGSYAELPGSLLLLVHPARGTTGTSQVAAGTVSSTGVASMSVDPGDCTTANPCVLALSAGSTPTMAQAAGKTLALVDTSAAGAGAGFAVAVDAVTEVTARISPVTSATLDLVADKGGQRVPNPVLGSACLWVSFPDIKAQRSVPVCNTDNPGKITIDTYEPNWASYGDVPGSSLAAALANGDTRSRYPFPANTTLRLTVDNPDGSCRYAPGMVGAQPGNIDRVGGAPTGWAPLAVCTSYTWGVPSRLDLDAPSGPATSQGFGTAGATLMLNPDRNLSGAVVWDNALLAPAAVGYGVDSSWNKPRTALGCTSDESCTSSVANLAAAVADPATGFPTVDYPSATCVADGSCRQAVNRLAPEAADCPREYCYSTSNSRPYLSMPASSTIQLSTSSTTTAFQIDIRDSDVEDPAATLSASVAAGSPPAGLTFTLGTPTTRPDGQTRRYPVTVVDNTGNTDLKVVTLNLTSGAGARQQSAQVDLGLYYTGGAWQITGADIKAAQGSANVPVPVRVTGTDGSPYPGAAVQFTTSAPGVTVTDTVTDASGYGTGVMSVNGSTPAGTYTVNASVAGSGRSVPLKLTVTAVAGGLSLSLDATTLGQGDRSTIRVRAADGAGGPVVGVVVNTVVTTEAGAPSSNVYPASSGCVTGSDGSCSVRLVVDSDATAGNYQVGASSGDLTATPQNLTVRSVPDRVESGTAINISQGQTLESVSLTVFDRAGNPIANQSLALAAPSRLTVSPATTVTDDSGDAVIAVSAASNAAVGKTSLTVTTGGKTLQVPVLVSASYGSITAPATYIAQGQSGQLTVTVSSGNGDPVANTDVDFFVEQSGIFFTPRGRTDSSGRASTVLDVDATVPAGAYPVTVIVAGTESTVTLTVTAVPTSISVDGDVTQGETSPVTLLVRDLAGDPVGNLDVTITSKPATFSLGGSTFRTNSDGELTLNVTDSGTRAGTYQLGVSAGTLSTTVPVKVIAVPGQIAFGSSRVRLTAGQSATLGITVTDRAGQPYTDAEVDIQGLPDNADVTLTGKTNSAGQTTAIFTAESNVIGGLYPNSVTVDDLTVNVPVLIIGSYSAAELRAGASLLLPLDDSTTTATDLLDRHNGTYVSGGTTSFTLRYDSPLLGSRAASFNPINGSGTLDAAAKAEVNVPDAGQDLLPATGSFSMSTWVNPESIAGLRTAVAFNKGNPFSTNAGFAVSSYPSTTTSLRITMSDGVNRVDVPVVLNAGSQPSDWVGKWTHVAVSVDRTTKAVTIYVNGVRQTNTVNVAAITGSVASSRALIVGHINGLYLFDGQMDEVAVFPTALTAGQAAGLAAAGAATDSYTQSTLAAGPTGFWRFGESSGTTAVATVGGNGSYASATLGRPGIVAGNTSADFSVLNATASLPTGVVSSSTEYSAFAWFFPTASGRTIADGILAGGSAASPAYNNPRLTWSNTNQVGSAIGFGSGIQISQASAPLALNTWHQVGFTVSGPAATPVLTLYVDGAKVGSKSSTVAVPPMGPTMAVGTREGVKGLPGRVDEVQLFDRALTDADVLASYRTVNQPVAKPSYDEAVLGLAPLGYWRLGETTGSYADSSGNGATASTVPPAGVTRGAPGLLAGDNDKALGRNGVGVSNFGVPTSSRFAVGTFSDVAWVNTPNFATGQYLAYNYTSSADASGTGTNYFGHALYVEPTTGRVRGYLGRGTAANTAWSFLTTTTVPTNAPVMVAYTYDGTTAKLYINGVLSATAVPPSAYVPAASYPYYIGVSSYPVQGTQDESATFGDALTAAEIAALYQAGR